MREGRAPALELWGGVECTVNRVRERQLSQLERNGHLGRLDDIDRFAALGLRALRVPILWEVCQPAPDGPVDFTRFSPMLARVRDRGLRAIAGLVHHGSGPMHTNLLDPAFEHGVARFARRVAEAHPWIEDYTPVNEPLTTARFSALYGHWYPHASDTTSFFRALIHQCRATVRAMMAIREVRPGARLVQTEDIASVRSTPLLAYQAEYENHRRFLSIDLLCGRVDRDHFMYPHLLAHGVGEHELAWFREHPCPPDLLGLNYYFTSERYLDESLSAHPAWSHGGNGRHAYADVDAGLVPNLGLLGHRHLLQTVWDRYRLPLIFSEVHAGCTREEQLRWLDEAWCGAHAARASGVDVRAVTVWSLLGAFDWNTLVQVEAGFYEPGVFDLRGPTPRPTALAAMSRGLAHEGAYDHPVLASDGWWRRRAPELATPRQTRARPLLITGAGGALAAALVRACEVRGLEHVQLTRAQLDVSGAEQVRARIAALGPWAIVNAAGVLPSDGNEAASSRSYEANARGPMVMADVCRAHGVRLLTFSSDHVFDGTAQRPYLETDAVSPRSSYGQCQAEAERYLLESGADGLLVRTSMLFGPQRSASSALMRGVHLLCRGQRVPVPSEAMLSPTYVDDLVTASLDLLIDGADGVWHLANRGAVSGAAFLRDIAARAQLPLELVDDEPRDVPLYAVLGSARGDHMPRLEDAVERWWRANAQSLLAALSAA
ncbi:MAG: family 1 glycosylhydrolase [Polyangiales bacterium]